MEKKSPTRPLLAALGTSFAVSLVATPMAYAEGNPFAAVEYQGGYMVAADEAKCGASMGEGKCGGAASDAKAESPAPAKEADAKAGEGKCGGASGDAKAHEGKCGS
ncbi:unnamed protein product [Phaeothamnion confervicola]